ncbi:MAG: hypothetical protein R3268_11870, partial [Acidiferrobacterales bacterium]|nr:hypothetical protein [Acidiferrobacterales bacterium]
GKAAWYNHYIDLAESIFFVPDKPRFLAEDMLGSMIRVMVAVGTGKNDNAKTNRHEFEAEG